MSALTRPAQLLCLIALSLFTFGCDDEPCEVVNTTCDRACEPGTVALCVAVNICECVNQGGPGGVMSGGVMSGGVMSGGVSIEPPPSCAAPVLGDLILNEALVDPTGEEPQEEFIELVNLSDQELDLTGVTITYEGNPKRSFTQGCMAPKSAVALFSDHSLTQWSSPPRAVAFQALPQFSLVNSRDADLELYDSQGVYHSALYIPTALIKPGDSATRSPDLSGEPARHSQVSSSGAMSSPAQCSNLGSFELDCTDGQGPTGGVMTGGVMTGGVMTGGVMTGGVMTGGVGAPLEGDPYQMIISELDYDQPSSDNFEFIEIKNNGPSRTTLAGLTLELINGNGDEVYRTIELSEAGVALDPGTYAVIGSAAVVNILPLGIPVITLPDSSIQNGPDGLRLSFQGNTVDELGYKGYTSLSATARDDDSDSEPDRSLSLCPTEAGERFILTRPSPARDNECDAL